MMTRKTLWPILTALLMASVGLAGCLTDDASTLSTDEGDDAGDTSGNQTFSGGNETTSDDDSTSEPPSAAIDVTGDDVAVNDTENGTVYEIAIGANITFDASASTDPAGGNLSFSWELGDGNTADGENVTYAYDAAGNYTVTVTATSDASGESAAAEVAIVALAAAAEDSLEPLVFEGESTIGNPAHSQICLRDGIDGDAHDFPEEYIGTTWTLTDGYVVYWWNGGSFVGGGESGTGTVPDGVNRAEVCDASDIGGSYTFTVGAVA